MVLVARWLTTGQVHRAFFQGASADAARKRLRRLAAGGYLVKVQRTRMEESVFRLGTEGKKILELSIARDIALERHLPKQMEHFAAVNDIRIAAETNPTLVYFFAYWELPALRWAHALVPDAIFAVGNEVFAVEFDRGEESVRYFKHKKVAQYVRGFPGLPLSAVLVVAHRTVRMESLMKGIGMCRMKMIFSTIDLVRENGIWGKVFHEPGQKGLVGLLNSSCQTVSSKGGV